MAQTVQAVSTVPKSASEAARSGRIVSHQTHTERPGSKPWLVAAAIPRQRWAAVAWLRGTTIAWRLPIAVCVGWNHERSVLNPQQEPAHAYLQMDHVTRLTRATAASLGRWWRTAHLVVRRLGRLSA